MNRYDPARDPGREEWLSLDEQQRTALIEAYHRREQIRIPSPRLHAVLHCIVENQLALGESVVVGTLIRMRKEGLDRHDAIHAIGSVLAVRFHSALRDSQGGDELVEKYYDSLRTLTARAWRADEP